MSFKFSRGLLHPDNFPNAYRIYKKYSPRLLNIIFKDLRIRLLRFFNVKSFPNEDFPLDEYGRVAFYQYPFYRDDKKNKNYIAQFYKERFVTDNVIDLIGYQGYLAEILEASCISKNSRIVDISVPSLVPISITNKRTDRNYGLAEVEIDGQSIILDGLKQNSFHYLPVNKKSTLKVTSKQNLIIGTPIAVKQEKKNKKKLVVTLFIDGLSSKILNHSTLPNLMPNTNRFFRDGAKFYNCFSASEWTLTSVASIFSGLYPFHHGVTNPKGRITIGKNYKLLSEYFQDCGYLTAQICNNHRKNPSYGYVKGFDRTLYKCHMGCEQVITNALEHLDAFEDRDNYLWLSFFDLHHHLDFIPDLSSQKENSLADHSYKRGDISSVFLNYDQKFVNWYVNEIHRLDRYLNILFNYISNKYEDKDVLISLVSDHGQAYLGHQQELLSEQKLMTPMMFVGGGVESITSNEIIQNVDYMPTILKMAGIEHKDMLDGRVPNVFGGNPAREYTFSESIYPNRQYQVAIYDENYMFYLKSKNKLFGGEKINFNNCDYKLTKRINKEDNTSEQPELVSKYLDYLSDHFKRIN